MTHTVELATDTQELRDAYRVVASESMRCAPPDISLYPADDMTYIAVEHGFAYVARDDSGTICGAALVWDDGHVKWLTLPAEDSIAVMEALLDHYKDTTGVSPWGEITNDQLRETVYAHPLMHSENGVGTWRKDPT